jgi:hypothetical protein
VNNQYSIISSVGGSTNFKLSLYPSKKKRCLRKKNEKIKFTFEIITSAQSYGWFSLKQTQTIAAHI